MSQLISQHQQALPAASDHRPPIHGIVIARVERAGDGEILLRVPGEPLPILSTLCLCQPDSLVAGDAVAIAFQDGDPSRPVLLGPVVAGLPDSPSVAPARLVLTADSEITLRCGKASLSLTADGRAALRGVDVTTRASHTNRIRGGNVQIN